MLFSNGSRNLASEHHLGSGLYAQASLHDRGTLVLYSCPFLSNDIQPKAVCVDEFAFRKGHDYGATIMDAETGEVYAIEAGKNEEAIRRALAHVSCSVQFVVSDLAPAMKKAI